MYFKRKAPVFVFILVGVALNFALVISSAYAVRPGEVSWTAEFVAANRATAAMDPDEKVRCTDNLAIKFVSPEFWHYSSRSPDFALSKKVIKAFRSNTYYLVNARTKHTDATLEQMATKGLRQVVALGAGFDTRAYRYADKMPNIRFFEMDLPATITHKEKMAKTVLDKIPASLTYVAIDFNTQTIYDALKEAGYREDLVTLFIWEGVTMYISEEAVAATLKFVADHSAPTSAIVFDYISADIPRGDFSKHPRARMASFVCAAHGEPWVFGFEEGEAPTFVQKHGLHVYSDMSPEQMAQRYLVRSDGQLDGTPSSFYGLMHAVKK